MRIIIRVGNVRYKRERGQWTMRADVDVRSLGGLVPVPVYLCVPWVSFIIAARRMREQLEDDVRNTYERYGKVEFVWKSR